MAAGAAYTPIATTTGDGSSQSITFNSFSGYTDLILVTNAINTGGTKNIGIQFNGDTGTNYSRTALTYDLGSVTSNRNSGQSAITTTSDGISSTGPSTHIIHIMNYSNTNTYKTILIRNGNTSYGTDFIVGLWRSTAAITSFAYYITGAGAWSTSSTFTLYGVKAA